MPEFFYHLSYPPARSLFSYPKGSTDLPGTCFERSASEHSPDTLRTHPVSDGNYASSDAVEVTPA